MTIVLIDIIFLLLLNKWEKPESNYIDCLQSYDYPPTLFKYFVNIKVRFEND